MEDETVSNFSYIMDWDMFSYGTELKTRNNILKDCLEVCNKLTTELSLDVATDIGETIISELKADKEVHDKLLTANESISCNYESLQKEYKNIKEDLEKLEAINYSLQKDVKHLKEDEISSLNTYQETKLALQKARDTYTTYFDINVSTKVLTETTYEASLRFKGKDDMPPIKFVVDRQNRKVIEFHPNGALSCEEEEEIMKEFGDLKDLPGLLCSLRNIILKK
ncbi:hypothetical protein NQ315_015719 [Exocentrus adspersus]|uniref:Kinetochore protein SPC25 n=1 Tax=Exocentrus adspersus TaxID=1586481 RepID=A0AAV8W2Q9_9CUCU|nr:hypothetical protein NQ315_015719 [Exocentrus adspersus]